METANSRQVRTVSDAADAIKKKFARPYHRPWKGTRVINPSTYEDADKQGKVIKAMEPYLPSMGG